MMTGGDFWLPDPDGCAILLGPIALGVLVALLLVWIF